MSRHSSPSVIRSESSDPDVDDWLTDDEGNYLLDGETLVGSDQRFWRSQDMRSPSPAPSSQDDDSSTLSDRFYRAMQSLSLSSAPNSQHGDASSTVSDSTVHAMRAIPICGVLKLSLHEFCKHVSEHSCLRKARVVSVECYFEKAGLVNHKFLVLELRRKDRKDVWLRLDRLRGKGVSLSSFILGSGKTNANDTAQLASTRETLVEGATCENRQEFAYKRSPMLNDLRLFLQIIYEELLQYRLAQLLFKENCWFFCSLIQQHFSEIAGAEFSVEGPILSPSALDIRDRIRERFFALRATPVSSAFIKTLKAIRDHPATSRRTRSCKLTSTIIKCLESAEHLHYSTSPQGRDWHGRFLDGIDELCELLQAKSRFSEALSLVQHVAQFHRATFEMEPNRRPSLSASLSRLEASISRQSTLQPEDLCKIRQVAICCYRRAYEIDPPEYRIDYATRLFGLGDELRTLGELEKACVVNEECAIVFDETRESEPWAFYSESLSVLTALREDLTQLDRPDDVAIVDRELTKLDDSVAAHYQGLLRVEALYQQKPTDEHRDAYARALKAYSAELKKLAVPHHGEHSVKVAQQVVAVSCELFELHPETDRNAYIDALSELKNELELCGHNDSEEAAAAQKEYLAVLDHKPSYLPYGSTMANTIFSLRTPAWIG